MHFTGFRYRFFYITSKSYHTVAKQSPTAFFDSSFNYIKQNSQLVSFESLSHTGKKFPNPHPANSATSNYLQLDFGQHSTAVYQDDENNNGSSATFHQLKNPLNIMLPVSQGHVILSINSYQLIIPNLPNIDLKQVIDQTNKLTSSFKLNNTVQVRGYHTSAPSKQYKSDKITELRDSKLIEAQKPEEKQEVLKYYQPSIEDELPQPEQTLETFLNQQTNEIQTAFATGQYEKINSIYLALKRNDIVPSLHLYSLILKSICLRKIDDCLDDKLSILLNVYQDLIQQKLKPTCEIYSIVIDELLEASINSAITSNLSNNGCDFFKIAIDIFNASNCLHVQQYDLKIIEKILIGMNVYPGLINGTSLIEVLTKQENFIKNSTYYASLINYCKFTQDSKMAISLYEEFKTESIKDEELYKDQFKIYSSFISTLVSTGEVQLATKFLDRILTTIKNYEDYESKITMLLSSYILSLSKINFAKSLEIWSQFNSIEWIPEFTFQFYLNFLQDSLGDYQRSLKLYNYMVALPRPTVEQTIENHFITPTNNSVLSRFLELAIVENDKSTVLKMVKESFIRGTSFTLETYPKLFQFLNNEDLTVKIINNHGVTIAKPFEFLTYLTESIPNLPMYSISKTLYFKKLVHLYNMQKQDLDTFGFYVIFSSVFPQLKTNPALNSETKNFDEIKELIELCSPLILEFHDLNNYYTEFDTHATINFKNDLTDFYNKLIKMIDVEKLDGFSNVAVDAINMV